MLRVVHKVSSETKGFWSDFITASETAYTADGGILSKMQIPITVKERNKMSHFNLHYHGQEALRGSAMANRALHVEWS